MLEDGKEDTCGNYQMISTLEFVRFQDCDVVKTLENSLRLNSHWGPEYSKNTEHPASSQTHRKLEYSKQSTVILKHLLLAAIAYSQTIAS